MSSIPPPPSPPEPQPDGTLPPEPPAEGITPPEPAVEAAPAEAAPTEAVPAPEPVPAPPAAPPAAADGAVPPPPIPQPYGYVPPQPPSAPPPYPGGPYAGAPQPAAPKSSKVGWIVAGGITLALVVLAGALIALFSTLSSLGGGTAGGGDPVTPPVANCDGCITLQDTLALRHGDVVDSLSLAFNDDVGYAKPSTVGAYADSTLDLYTNGDGAPGGCAFALDYAPVSPTSPGAGNRADRVGDLGTYSSETDYLSLMSRVFATEADAVAYPDTVRAGVSACPHYSVWLGEGADAYIWETDVVGIDLPELSAGVTGAGWTEEGNGSRITVVDLQYANVAVRMIIDRATGSPTSDEQVQAYLVELSERLAALGR